MSADYNDDGIYTADGVEYEIVHTPPPIYPLVREKWGVKWEDKKVVMVYGNKIHQSFYGRMDQDLLVHELVHVKQHAAYPGGPEAWWARYLEDKDFRMEMELEAYRTQYAWCKEHLNSETRRSILKHCANDLSSNLYGHMVSYQTAKELIQQV